TDIVNGHDVWVVEVGDRACFDQISLSALGTRDEVAVGYLDRHEAVQLLIVGEIDTSEATLTETLDDPVASDRRRTAARVLARTDELGFGTFGVGQVLRLIRGATGIRSGGLRALGFGWILRLVHSSVLESTDHLHDRQAEPLSHSEPRRRSGAMSHSYHA